MRVWLDAAAVPWAREVPAFGLQREEPAEGGSVWVFHSWNLRRLLPWVLSWGASARVLAPPEVVGHLRREAEALAHSYADA